MTVLECHTFYRPDGQRYVFIPALSLLTKSGIEIDEIEIPEGDFAAYRQDFIDDRLALAAEEDLTMIHVVPTGLCKGGCKYCYAMEAWKDVDYITPETLAASLERNAAKPESFHIYGGEPLINMPGFVTIMKWITTNYPDARTGISTGLMVEQEDFDTFLNWLDWSMPERLWVSCSIDPYDPDFAYTRRRWGNKTYGILLERFDQIYQKTKNVGIRFTITKNGHNPFPMLFELYEKYGAIIPCTIELEDTDRFALTDEQLTNLLEDHKRWVNEILVPQGHLSSEDPQDRFICTPLSHIFTRRSFLDSSRSCPAGASALSINTDGGVSGCSRIVELGLPQVYADIEEEAMQRYLNPKGLPCDTCEYLASCGGGCAESLRLYSKEMPLEPLSCKWRKAIIRYSAQVLVENGNQKIIDAVLEGTRGLSEVFEDLLRVPATN